MLDINRGEILMWSPHQNDIVTPEGKKAKEIKALVSQFSGAIQTHLDEKAQEYQYDNIHTAVSYREDENQRFAQEGRAFFEWRSRVWTYAMDKLAKVEAGEIEPPKLEDFIASLPEFEPPEWRVTDVIPNGV